MVDFVLNNLGDKSGESLTLFLEVLIQKSNVNRFKSVGWSLTHLTKKDSPLVYRRAQPFW